MEHDDVENAWEGFIHTHISPIHMLIPVLHKNYSWGNLLLKAKYIMTYGDLSKVTKKVLFL